MSERKGGLGRGLAALIPSGPAEDDEDRDHAPQRDGSGAAAESDSQTGANARAVSAVPSGETQQPAPETQDTEAAPSEGVAGGAVAGAVYREIPLAKITPNPRQPRQVFDEEALAELQHSIREFGLMQPIVVRELDDEYELIMGERRWRAAQRAELTTIPAIVRQTQNDALLRDALLENIHRVPLNPLEEASAYQQLLDEFDVTHDELAGRIGRSRPVITNTIRLLRLPLPVQRRVAAGVLSAGHARALLSVEEPDVQENLAARIVQEGLSVRATEEAVTLARSEDPPKPKAAQRQQPESPVMTELSEYLSDAFETQVKVELGKRKGRLNVEFASLDDLRRLLQLIAPEAVDRVPDGEDR